MNNISYDKNSETIQKIIDSSPKAKQYYSDGYNWYFNLNYHWNMYKSLNNKSQTHKYRKLNLDFRKYKVNLNVFLDLSVIENNF